ncbi:MFS transporter [Paraburkholderia sp. HP33-1]|uniref:MFS transporter n=1 Tax=Paraburkholderia sp. HP33-1 TaxID=2883243 RepID=UPI001F19429D|nr:MFS transporter [Paraburkholderia sp. HP33-1]
MPDERISRDFDSRARVDDAPFSSMLTPEAASPKKWLSKEVKVLSAANFISAVGFGIQSPTIPVFARQLGVGSAMVGAIIAAFALGRIIANVPAGRLIDRFGTIPVLTSGMCILASASLLAGLSASGWQLTLFRGLCGAGSAIYTVAAMSLLILSSDASHRGRVVSLYMGAFYLGATAGPAIGATMSSLSPRLSFFIYGAGVAASAWVIYFSLRSSQVAPQKKSRSSSPRIDLIQAFRIPAFRSAFFCNFGVGWASYGVRVSILPLFLLNSIHDDKAWIGIALALGASVQALMLPVAGTTVDLIGRRFTLICGQAALLCAYLLVIATPGRLTYLACFAVLAVGTALSVPAGSALIGDLSKSHPGGGALVGTHQMAADLGTIVGSVITGWIAQKVSYYAAFGLTACMLLLSLASATLIGTASSKEEPHVCAD